MYFIDDLNTPTKDKYDTQTALELIRQAIDNKGWYDKTKNVQKEVNGTHYIACMNPTSGSFTITPRLQRQFATFAVQPPTDDTIRYFIRLLFLNQILKHTSTRIVCYNAVASIFSYWRDIWLVRDIPMQSDSLHQQ